MGKTIDYKTQEAKYHDGQPNTVLSVTPVQTFAVRFTNAEGRETMCLVDTFGKLDDGELGIFIKANERKMSENLRVVPSNQLQQIRQKIADLGLVSMTTDEIPGTPAPGVAEALDDVVKASEATA